MSRLLPADRHSTSRDGEIGRIRVEDGSTAFANGTGFRVSEPLSLDAALSPTTYIEFNSPIDFTLVNQSVSCDLGGFSYEVYRADQGVVGTPFTDDVRVLKRNARSDAPAYIPVITLKTGGVFTPAALAVPVDTIRVIAGAQVKKITNVSGVESSSRGLPAGSYYIIVAAIAGITGLISGVLELLYDEQ